MINAKLFCRSFIIIIIYDKIKIYIRIGEEMKEQVKNIIKKYLERNPNEENRLLPLLGYLERFNEEEIIDWNNTSGHITVGAFVYCKTEDKFLVLHHKDLDMFLYPGGHVDKKDNSLLDAAKRELKEETGIKEFKLLETNDKILPIDIDIHLIPKNERVNMSEHFHFDFRYLFLIDSIDNIKIDKEEFYSYRWISIDELSRDKNFGSIINKLKEVLI